MKELKKITCSGLARPMTCAGFVFLDLPKDTRDYGKEGTAAGEYLEKMLMNMPIGEIASNGYCYDDDIKFYMKSIYDNIMSRSPEKLICEEKINWQTRSGVWITGRPDVAFEEMSGDRLCVEDAKYGWNLIEVEKNWQLIAYAIGECIRRGKAYKEISLKIHQPRPHHEDGPSREWIISYPELLAYKEQIEVRMQELTDGKRDFQTSANCKYCMGTGEACPAFNRLFYRSLEIATEFCQDSIDNDELAIQLNQVKRAEEVLKIKKDSLTELGSIRIKEGQIIPGYIQEKSYGNRTWKKGFSPESIKIMTGIDVIEKKFMSPAKAEKLGVPKEMTSQLVEKYFKGNILVKKDATKVGNKIFGTNNPVGGK